MDLAGGRCGSRGEGTVAGGSGRETLPSSKGSHWWFPHHQPRSSHPAMDGGGQCRERANEWSELGVGRHGLVFFFSLKSQHIFYRDFETGNLGQARDWRAANPMQTGENENEVTCAPPFLLYVVKVSKQADKVTQLPEELARTFLYCLMRVQRQGLYFLVIPLVLFVSHAWDLQHQANVVFLSPYVDPGYQGHLATQLVTWACLSSSLLSRNLYLWRSVGNLTSHCSQKANSNAKRADSPIKICKYVGFFADALFFFSFLQYFLCYSYHPK